jgi:hypothetical protein
MTRLSRRHLRVFEVSVVVVGARDEVGGVPVDPREDRAD